MTLKVNIHIFGLTKYTNYTVKNVPVFVPVLLYAVTMLIFHIKRIISSEKINGSTMSLLFFFFGLNDYVSILANNIPANFF